MKLGPDAHWTDRPDDYDFPAHDVKSLRDIFYQTVKTYLPSINREKLQPDYVGIRPKLSSPEDPAFRDFVIQEETSRGFPGLVNLVGIESPGLTSSLAIARYVSNLIGYNDRDDEFDL